MKNDIYLFCSGERCLLRNDCHRFVDGKGIDKSAAGYSWMEYCDEEERLAYLSRQKSIA